MATPQQRLRRRQRIESLSAAVSRALTGKADIAFRGHRLVVDGKTVSVLAPHLRLSEADRFVAYRAVADGIALRLMYSDAALHRAKAPESAVGRLVFDWLEQLRVESLVPAHLPGVADNLATRFTDWALAFHHARYTEGEIGEMLYAVILATWTALTGRPIPEASERAIEVRRGDIAPLIGHAVAGMRRLRHDQPGFATHALAIVAFISQHAPPDLGEDTDEGIDSDRAAFSLLLDFDSDESEGYAAALFGESEVLAAADHQYRVFTSAYDAEEDIASLVRGEQLVRLRGELDTTIAELPVNVRRLARYFRAELAVSERSDWLFGEESGYIDGRRLAQLVSAPTERRAFKRERNEPKTDAAIGFLIDCSGSMKAQGEFVALVIDRLATALSMAGAKTEILGFTTGEWSGGRARQDWMKQGRPAHPGRLNSLRHLVFKTAQMPWRRTRRQIAALLKPDLYREGIDGEAVNWACMRLLAQPCARRILVVISDGSPMDSSTQLANDRYYLDNHLKQVVARRQRQGDVEIRGLGVGLDLRPFYPASLVVDPAATIDNELLSEIALLITTPERR